MQDQLTARLIAAILQKFGETSVEITYQDLHTLPPGQVETWGDPFKDGAVTYRFTRYPEPGAPELPLEQEKPTDLTKVAAQLLSDDELRAEYERVCNEFDNFGKDDEFEGRGGSPMEGLSERLSEIETAAKNRKVSLT